MHHPWRSPLNAGSGNASDRVPPVCFAAAAAVCRVGLDGLPLMINRTAAAGQSQAPVANMAADEAQACISAADQCRRSCSTIPRGRERLVHCGGTAKNARHGIIHVQPSQAPGAAKRAIRSLVFPTSDVDTLPPYSVWTDVNEFAATECARSCFCLLQRWPRLLACSSGRRSGKSSPWTTT